MSKAFDVSGFLIATFLARSSLLTSYINNLTFDVRFVLEDAECVVHFVVSEELVDNL